MLQKVSASSAKLLYANLIDFVISSEFKIENLPENFELSFQLHDSNPFNGFNEFDCASSRFFKKKKLPPHSVNLNLYERYIGQKSSIFSEKYQLRSEN